MQTDPIHHVHVQLLALLSQRIEQQRVRNPIAESEGLAKWLAQRKCLTSGRDASRSSETGYKNGRCASLVPSRRCTGTLPPSGRAKADAGISVLRRSCHREGI